MKKRSAYRPKGVILDVMGWIKQGMVPLRLAGLRKVAAGGRYIGAELAESRSAEARRLRFTGVVETLARSVTMEMDLRLEAAALV
mgnify:CR=1 FL=1